ncbi:hypothetical protein [Roseinatronobacter monicus]|uniref:hypothetical protein n=1 Tax=Roseinatronobacter monicus TaxID=393481 RepID=UPI003F365665
MKIGIQIFDRDGHLYFETGAHVLASVPGFTAKIGEIAAIWAVAEGHLGCLYANLLETTPQDALDQLGKPGAKRLTENAKQIAKEKLNGNELAQLLELLEKLDAVRDRRNRVQHDLWSRREGKEEALYSIHVDDYRRLILEVVEHAKSDDKALGADQSISAANKYAANASNEYTLDSLEHLRAEIEAVLVGLSERFSERVKRG